MKKGFTEIVFILDRSGSMSGLELDTIGGFNSMLEKQRKEEGDACVSVVLFDDRTEVLYDRVDIQRIEPMNDTQYYVRAAPPYWTRSEERSITSVMYTSMRAKRMCLRRHSLSSRQTGWRMQATDTATIESGK